MFKEFTKMLVFSSVLFLISFQFRFNKHIYLYKSPWSVLMSSLLRVQDRSTRGVLLILAFELGLLLSLRATFLLIYVMVYLIYTSSYLPYVLVLTYVVHTCVCFSFKRKIFEKSPSFRQVSHLFCKVHECHGNLKNFDTL